MRRNVKTTGGGDACADERPMLPSTSSSARVARGIYNPRLWIGIVDTAVSLPCIGAVTHKLVPTRDTGADIRVID